MSSSSSRPKIKKVPTDDRPFLSDLDDTDDYDSDHPEIKQHIEDKKKKKKKKITEHECVMCGESFSVSRAKEKCPMLLRDAGCLCSSDCYAAWAQTLPEVEAAQHMDIHDFCAKFGRVPDG